jgi:hypothetical protein
MANKVKRKFLLLWAKTLALCISLLGAFICTNVAVGGQRQEVETAPQATPVDTSQNMPIKIKKIRIGSSTSREFRKETSEEITIKETTVPPSPPIAQNMTQVKESKNVGNLVIKQVYGNIQIGKKEDGSGTKPAGDSRQSEQVQSSKSPNNKDIVVAYGPPATKVKETKSVEKVSVPQVYGNIQIGKPEDVAPKKP